MLDGARDSLSASSYSPLHFCKLSAYRFRGPQHLLPLVGIDSLPVNPEREFAISAGYHYSDGLDPDNGTESGVHTGLTDVDQFDYMYR